MFSRKYQIRYTHDPKKEWYLQWKAEIFMSRSGLLMAASSWTYSKNAAKREAKQQLKMLEHRKKNTQPRVRTHDLW